MPGRSAGRRAGRPEGRHLQGELARGGHRLAGRHEAWHGTLFQSKWLNDVFADRTCARPLWQNLARYKVHHFVHPMKTGSAEDTDISLAEHRADLVLLPELALSGYVSPPVAAGGVQSRRTPVGDRDRPLLGDGDGPSHDENHQTG